mmetsp:Transcript_11380/g.32664  ORF Transcript_11380/g.32664 Transcript_11380/m.32664 type:complete len:1038 (-) Transcript_11380:211-3324(-)|eukprot:CAMPEP_0119547190 /NCGR_PEP_ID=MMETSP1352-20130426/1375_1 /TAXON_ID=265584 /ORGANISM="Stauroneis constricta, Strain CCMP1120" /LENGTH=1037 /DNA_ID=CAMNT_0007592047 /DNA_START=178 /DNA_END=3291 /DNA_ORIENTATION=-
MPRDQYSTSSSSRSRNRQNNGSSRSGSNRRGNNGYNDDYYEDQSQSTRSRSTNRPNVMDDDDFSVAPSMEQDVKSISSFKFDDVYARGRKLGLGAFAVVFIGTHRPTKSEYAVKQIDRSTMFWNDRDALQDEIANLKLTREGPNIVQLYEVYEEKAFCYLVMELMEGGELLEYIVEKKTFTEREARDCSRCVLSALKYMHEKHVAHRDIKPENLLLSEQHNLSSIKLADFSFAKYVSERNGCRTLCGTPGYLAPEMLERFPAYDVKCDVWSVGTLLYLLLGGYLPFDDEDDDVIFEQTRNGQFSFPHEFWQGVSKGAKDLIIRMLTNNPKKRISASSALRSSWVQNGDEISEQRQVNWKKLKLLIEGKNKMKKAVNTLITANRVKDLNNTFKEYTEKRKDQSVSQKMKKKDKERFVEDSLTGKPFDEFYEIGAELGEGGYAFVYQCTHKRTTKTYAVKEVILSRLENGGESTLKDEIAALKMLRGGPHIVRLFDVFMEEDHCFMVMEEMKGGDLLSRIVDKEVYTEREARGVCKTLFEAVDYCHKKHIAHRDIKPENLLLVTADDDMSIKIADFGFAKKVSGVNSLSTLCGTAQYVAPEVLDCQVEGYSEMCDMWSVGVVTYILLGGYAPFEGPPDELAQFIIRGDYEFHDRYWSEITQAAKDMITGMLEVDPSRRLSAEEALHCEWMALNAEALAATDLKGTRDQMRDSMPDIEATKKAKNAIIATNKFMSLGAMTSGLLTETRLNAAHEEPEFDFEDIYEWGKQIGIGTFSVIHRSVNRETKGVFAVKRVPRNDLWEEDAVALQNEISSLRLVADCEYVVRLHEVFDEPDFTYMVLEELMGGYLIDKIIEKTCYDEDEGREVCFRLISGLAYCHEQRVAVRDLKPENILLMNDSDVDVKISDFGYAKKVHNPNSLTTICGTEGFVAPEIIENSPEYDVECDVWSLGVVIYIILGGYRPFRGEGDVCLERVRYGKYKFHQKYWGRVSEESKDLIRSMLVVDPSNRIKASEALQAPWITMSESEEEYQQARPRTRRR